MTRKKIMAAVAALVAVGAMALMGGSFYMLNFSLKPDPNRGDMAPYYAKAYKRLPDMKPWVDSLRERKLLRDTFVTMDDGRRAHALYLRGDSAHGRTAVVVHGYKDCCITFLYLGRMYHRDFGFNILLPDLSAHGFSDGESIQMGWKDRLDLKRWTAVARNLFASEADTVSVVVHGVSMGAATTMCLSGEELPPYVKCFIEDCGYTSVWDEFKYELDEQFGLPAFPLMYTTSALCSLRYGWRFGEASPLGQVAKCRRPMLFIHGSSDTYVPTWMVYPLYSAKQQPKELWIAPNSEHARSYLDHPREYTQRVRRFLERHFRQ